MHSLQFLLFLLLAVVLVVIFFRRLGLPPILGYLVVGVVVGPHAFSIMKDVRGAEHLAEFGVVFLMFSIGLEFSLPKLYAMKRLVFGLGMAQVLLTMAVAAALALGLGLSWQGGVALGGAVAMSSTAVLSKLLAERMELESPHGREVLGVLLFQDLAVVPLLILIPAFTQPPSAMALELAWALLKAAGVLTVVLFLGQKLVRPWFFIVARGKSAELFILNILLITLGLAHITEMAGLSLALGAFVAGMLISETEYRYQVEEDIKPFRDVLMGLFFITVGMLLDLHEVLRALPWVAAGLVALLAAKFGIVALLSRAFGATPGNAMRSGLWLCAGGEFGFVLLTDIADAHLLPARVLQVTLSVLVLSLLLAPLIVQFSEKIVLRFARSEWMLRSMALTRMAAQTMATEKHAIICGFGRSGQYLARYLAQEGVSYVALDLDPERVQEAAAAGENVVYGDASQRENLMAVGAARASVIIVSFANVAMAEKILFHAREIKADLPVIVRAADEGSLEVLSRAGAAEVVAESLEASLMLGSHALVLLGVPMKRVLRRLRAIRAKRYKLLRGFFKGGLRGEEEPEGQESRLHSIVLPEGAYGVGKSIGELALAPLGVEVSAIRRRDIRAMEPLPETRFLAGDVVVLLGTDEALDGAERRLLKG
ncbi:monovalent cation:proton antiporter family protein [Azospira inquinata]|uniref:Cation:proton antiporter n=1 Tax=Azospira inquinata TaxID=2785627 RepID=A0A975XVJ1_9RHOO|nr:monovalent cation:proton antiporter family protein [Azospira inquinata]QWT47514.1 cation:proton antiporter [Azospira inquinata]QWT49860.1 cation:proton antiporter [Azospira inquinata]